MIRFSEQACLFLDISPKTLVILEQIRNLLSKL